MKNFDLLTFSDADQLARAAAEAWLDEIESAHRAGQRHCVALSGGRIAQKFFASTVDQAKARNASFAHVHFFWADDRCVPPADPDSNFKLAQELLFTPLNIAAEQIHRIRGEAPPAVAVNLAEQELRQFAPANERGMPILDLIFLGMGEDGHVASLFPDKSAKYLDNFVPFLVVKNSPKPPSIRISLTYHAIFAAKTVWVLVSGPGKSLAFRESVSPKGSTPLGRVIRMRSVKIFSDINEF